LRSNSVMVVAPMPPPSEITAIAHAIGYRLMPRRAVRTSCLS
jgi:hypothetical protein